ncbi:VWA domain-containing protein [Roseobacter denitrificans]|uniref:Magnesium-chelatase 60 kDa subunit n=1 Tax=Roseobacter denitrificans (strain ATCC 33942 / OCh 114) TaxID=375451 RepID=Q16DT5_ROSDO|nr:magnesium chelatase subunit D [Roseobacter denitrificans]ABG29858.1 magnesium-chelatase 60 kDa subunit [Roseobacter denitrificans OCh 114]AVL53074.1 VWA domain-containing protein [Roseobacter denitrificans]SFG25727.1 protoporphyrin IX magnesium-chelatase [Roseobacter denitrificans OCh 114]
MSHESDSWDRAALALRLLTVENADLGGAVIRMRASPARDHVLAALRGLKLRKIHPTISDDQLFGGLDLAATLESSHLVENTSFFDDKTNALLVMAERCGTGLAAKLAQILDRDAGHMLIALDEGAEADEHAPPALADRLALHIEPEGRMPEGWQPAPAGTSALDPRHVTVSAGDIQTLAEIAAVFGIDSLRAPLLALRVARAHAALNGRDKVTDSDLNVAAELTYPHRATRLPQEPDAAEDPPAPPEDSPEDDAAGDSDTLSLPEGDMLVEAVKALLPPDLLAGLAPAGTSRGASGAGAGQKRKGNRRGRPLPSRPGRLDGRARIDLVATLRAAAPWQPLRQRAVPTRTGLHIRPSDIRLKRYQEQSDRLLIFTVDASGSAAMSRLNEAKGAVELLLAQAYAARDHVALVAFRGEGAELLLPPTRSLVQTKRRLASLPGGGGTPLAAGLQQAALLAQQSRSKGLTPTVVVLTDGRANIALDGTPDRTAAQADSEQMAQIIQTQNIAALVIDMSKRPQEPLRALSARLGAPYLALPRADAERLTGAVNAALDA